MIRAGRGLALASVAHRARPVNAELRHDGGGAEFELASDPLGVRPHTPLISAVEKFALQQDLYVADLLDEKEDRRGKMISIAYLPLDGE